MIHKDPHKFTMFTDNQHTVSISDGVSTYYFKEDPNLYIVRGYFEKGVLHCDFGPAVISTTKNGKTKTHYYFNGKRIPKYKWGFLKRSLSEDCLKNLENLNNIKNTEDKGLEDLKSRMEELESSDREIKDIVSKLQRILNTLGNCFKVICTELEHIDPNIDPEDSLNQIFGPADIPISE